MAEITAMLNLGQPDDQPSSHDPDFVEVASTCISKPKRQEICSPKQNRNHKHIPVQPQGAHLENTAVLSFSHQASQLILQDALDLKKNIHVLQHQARQLILQDTLTHEKNLHVFQHQARQLILQDTLKLQKNLHVFQHQTRRLINGMVCVLMVSSFYDMDNKHVQEMHTNFTPVVSDKNEMHFNNEAHTICN
ncbi:unnamed protein product [Mytilus coruscus]|uniref:Uncharacterized protein n=1 Tax=Mytilus coruscus TaxID=42192 RepID=A0A6J7ZZQ6_MYTCO|nr:unnamed protein product [Mytilus coruscus]